MRDTQADILWAEKVPGQKGPCLLRESIFQCTRCNACVQHCPSYLNSPQEMFSPRGRVQMLRLLAENKIKWSDCKPFLSDIVSSCALCGQCTGVCAGQVPVAFYMRALEQIQHQTRIGFSLRMLLRALLDHPLFFDYAVRLLLWLHRTKILFVLSPFLPKWLRHADRILPVKSESLSSIIKQNNFETEPKKSKLIYLPSLYAAYADGQAGWSTVELIASKKPTILNGYSSGLAEYLYDTAARARQAAKRLLVQWEKLSGSEALPLLTDSIEVYSFLKNYPILFADFSGWQARAEKLAEHVIFITDLPTKRIEKNSGRVGLDTSGVLFPSKEIILQTQKILLTDRRSNLLEFEYSRFPLPTAGLGFGKQKQTEELVRKHIQDVKRKEIAEVYCLSGWAALELQAACKHLYPLLKAQHLIYGMKGYGKSQKRNNAAVRGGKVKPAH